MQKIQKNVKNAKNVKKNAKMQKKHKNAKKNVIKNVKNVKMQQRLTIFHIFLNIFLHGYHEDFCCMDTIFSGWSIQNSMQNTESVAKKIMSYG